MDAIVEPIEDGLDKIGLMQGELAPLKRTVLGGVGGYLVVSTWKPTWAYDDNGNAYPWRVTHRDLDPKQTTMMPYWLASLIPAFVLGVLI